VIARLWELLTGTSYYTVRSASVEFGPTPATAYPELLDYTDAELMRRDRDEILAEIRQRRAALARPREVAR